MQEALAEANKSAEAWIAGDRTVDPEAVLKSLNDKIVEKFGGWLDTFIKGIEFRLPRNPNGIISEFTDENKKRDLKILLWTFQFCIRGKWYCVEETELYLQEIAENIKIQMQCETCSSGIPCDIHKGDGWSNEIQDEQQWFNSIAMVMRGLLVDGKLTVSI